MLALACAALALWVQRRALGAYFSPDDLVHFERIRGLLPNPVTPWRLLSNQAYMSAALARFGADPVPYHLVNWLLHGLNVVLVYAATRALGAGRAAAVAAAGLFGASRLFMAALFQAVGFGELMALTATLAALGLAARRGAAAGWAASAAFAVALLSKETVAFAPAAVLLCGAGAEARPPRRGPVLLLLALGAGYFAYLTASNASRIGAGGDAYQASLGPELFHNLMTYAAWAVDLRNPIPDVRTAIDPGAWRVGLWVILGWAAVAALTFRRTRLPALGLAWFLFTLMPVLPLAHHTFAYYLYVPFAGLALAVGGTLATLAPRRRWRGALVALVVGAHAWNADRLLDQRLRLQVPGVGLPLDPFVRKCEVARRTVTSFATATSGRRLSAVLYSPAVARRYFGASSGREMGAGVDSAAYDIVREVLDQGRALRALQPGLDTLAFVSRWTAELDDFDLFIVGAGGQLVSMGRGAPALQRVGGLLIRKGYAAAARDFLAEAVRAHPDDPPLRYMLGYVLDALGERAAARAELEELVRRSPGDSLATRALSIVAGGRSDAGARAR
jgi:hypothetical protein